MPDYQDFHDRLDRAFTLTVGDREVDLVLVECTEANHPQGPNTYSLTFRTDAALPMDQGTYLLSADGIAPMPIFLVPIARTEQGLDLQAVFTTVDV